MKVRSVKDTVSFCAYARSIGYSKVSLSVDPLNKVALHLYEKIGFEKVYQDSGGSWTMKKEL